MRDLQDIAGYRSTQQRQDSSGAAAGWIGALLLMCRVCMVTVVPSAPELGLGFARSTATGMCMDQCGAHGPATRVSLHLQGSNMLKTEGNKLHAAGVLSISWCQQVAEGACRAVAPRTADHVCITAHMYASLHAHIYCGASILRLCFCLLQDMVPAASLVG